MPVEHRAALRRVIRAHGIAVPFMVTAAVEQKAPFLHIKLDSERGRLAAVGDVAGFRDLRHSAPPGHGRTVRLGWWPQR